MDRYHLAIWAGRIGPPLFVATFTIEGWLRSGYDLRRQFISELALGPRGWIQRVNFVVLGALTLLFAGGVAAEFREGKESRAGPFLLRIIGVSFLASGLFVMDPVTTPPEQQSRPGKLHSFFGGLVFSLAPISCFVFLRRFWTDARWRPLRWWTLSVGTISAASVVAMVVGPTPLPAAPNAFNRWIGLIQRTALVPYLAWLCSVAWRLGRRTIPRGRHG